MRASEPTVLAYGRLRLEPLRHHRLRQDGSVRDTAYFSVLAAEWPGVHDGLRVRLAL